MQCVNFKGELNTGTVLGNEFHYSFISTKYFVAEKTSLWPPEPNLHPGRTL
jgi:hypothetical protein